MIHISSVLESANPNFCPVLGIPDCMLKSV
jgi:hypothetical protein